MKTNLKRVFVSMLAVLSLTTIANAAFTKTNTYTKGQFKDVKDTAWYEKEVSSAYELGFMNGTASDVFSPDGNVTVAQGITIASRVNASYNGKGEITGSGKNWYDVYVDYAKKNGLITENQFDDYNRNITRAEMATLFANAVPEKEFAAKNDVKLIPDVNVSASYAEDILMLYKAGVVMGSDNYGTFNPDADIKRSEAAAIINRVAIPENRLSKTLKEYTARDAYQFLYFDGSFSNGLTNHQQTIRENIDSGWRIDNRGGTPRISIEEVVSGIRDVSDKESAALIRDFNKIENDRIDAEFSLIITGNGGYFEFRDENGKPVYSMKNVDGKWSILGKDGKYTSLVKVNEGKNEMFRLSLDLVSGKAETFINNASFGETELLSDNILNFRFAFDEKGKGSITPGPINMTANYGTYEIFDTFGLEEVYGWKKEGEAAALDGELVLSGKSSVSKTFDAVDTKYIAEMMAIFPNGENTAFKIMSADKVAVELKSENGKLYANGKEVYTLTKNMWYRLRIEANPSAGKAQIVVNGREMGEVSLNTTNAVDSFAITSESGKARFDDIMVYAYADHYDYVPIPSAKASFDDYITVINICSLWRNIGNHYGWACITPYDDRRPVLGYYDEGIAESADWEIKFMAEHGIDAQAICWYSDSSKGPLKNPRHSYQLHDGIQIAKYQDYMKYCLIWEVSNSDACDSAQFRNYVVPYWFENYFLDENYLVLDNKLVLHMFGSSSLTSSKNFGSFENAKKELDYLRETAKKYGFDGVLIFSNGNIADLEKLGVDGTAAYHWDAKGYMYETNVNGNMNNRNASKTVYTIPTVSVGYSDFAWRGSKMPNMSLEDYKKTNEWVVNEYLPKYAKKGTWQEKLVWLSTWNEYGEGTYMMPSGLNEFGYLDVLRDVYTDLPETHTDHVPTSAQAERIQHLYPQYIRLLRRQGDYVDPYIQASEIKYETVKTFTFNANNTKLEAIANPVYKDGAVSGTSTEKDFKVYMSDVAGVDISDIDAVRVNLKEPAGQYIQVFFSTENEPNLSEDKSIMVQTNTSEKGEYLFEFANKCTKWDGKLKEMRVDPANGEGISFELYSVEFLREKEQKIDEKYAVDAEIYVNTIAIKSAIYPEWNGNKLLFPFDPETSIDHIMHAFLNWDHDNKVLTLEANGHKVEFSVGSNKYTLDGREKSLGYTLYAVDGIPMLCMKTLSDALGFKYKADGEKIYIETDEIQMYNDLKNSEGIWNFNGYDTAGWTSPNMKFVANGEYLSCDNTYGTNGDPNMSTSSNLGFHTEKYSKLEVRVRYKYESQGSQGFTFYYITSIDNHWNETKTIRASFETNDTKGEWKTYTVDLLSNPAWVGNVTGLRFDPFNAIGTMDIDYIKFIPNPDYVEKEIPEEDKKVGIKNGDAENTTLMTFSSPTADVTIVKDSTKEGNHAFQFTGHKKKSWTYAVQPYPFMAGRKYKIAFDARAVSDSDGNKVRMNLALNVQYASDTGKDHHGGTVWLEADGAWVHFETVFTVGQMNSQEGAAFSCYITPPSDTTSGTFQLDNVVVEEIR